MWAGSGDRWGGSVILCETQTGWERQVSLGVTHIYRPPPFFSYWRGPCQIIRLGAYLPGPLPGSQKIKPHSVPVPRKMGLVRFAGTPYRLVFMVFWEIFLQP